MVYVITISLGHYAHLVVEEALQVILRLFLVENILWVFLYINGPATTSGAEQGYIKLLRSVQVIKSNAVVVVYKSSDVERSQFSWIYFHSFARCRN